MGACELGYCEVCGEKKPLKREYYHYDIDCSCCGNGHFEIVFHCIDCYPTPPQKFKAVFLEKKPLENK